MTYTRQYQVARLLLLSYAVLVPLLTSLYYLRTIPYGDEIVPLTSAGCTDTRINEYLSRIGTQLSSIEDALARGRVECPLTAIGYRVRAHYRYVYGARGLAAREHPPLSIVVDKALCRLLGNSYRVIIFERILYTSVYTFLFIDIWVRRPRRDWVVQGIALHPYASMYVVLAYNESLAFIFFLVALRCFSRGRRLWGLFFSYLALVSKYQPFLSLLFVEPLVVLVFAAAFATSLAYWGWSHVLALREASTIVLYGLSGSEAICAPIVFLTRNSVMILYGIVYVFLVIPLLVYYRARYVRDPAAYGSLAHLLFIAYLAMKRTVIGYYFLYPAVLASYPTVFSSNVLSRVSRRVLGALGAKIPGVRSRAPSNSPEDS